MAKDITFEIRAGHGQQLGANYDGKGVNFALFSAHAERVELCLFDPSGKTEIARLELPEYTHEVWHGYVPDLKPGGCTAIASTAPTIRKTVTALTRISCLSIRMPVNWWAISTGTTPISAMSWGMTS